MKRPYTTLTGKPICRGCDFENRGGGSRKAIPHTCGKSEASDIKKELKQLKNYKRIF